MKYTQSAFGMKLRSAICLWQQITIFGFSLAIIVLASSGAKMGPELDWLILLAAIVLMPAAFASLLNTCLCIVEGRKQLRWRSPMQLVAFFALSLPLFGYLFWRHFRSRISRTRDAMTNKNSEGHESIDDV